MAPVLDELPPILEVAIYQDASVDISNAFVRFSDSQQHPAKYYRLIVDDPNIVSVAVGDHTLTITGVKAGQTTITVAGIGEFQEATHPQQIMVEVMDVANVCERTKQVRDGIITALSISGDPAVVCQDVSFIHLATISTLNLSAAGINALQDGDFDGLTGLDELDLSDNPFDEGLPDLSILFPHGIPATLHLDFVAILDGLPPTLEVVVGENVSANISSVFVYSDGSQQFPAENYRIVVDNANVAATVANGMLTVTGVAAGQTTMLVVGVKGSREVTHPQPVMVTVFEAVCNRTEEVLDAILAVLEITECQNVGADQLATIQRLILGGFVNGYNYNIDALQNGDFSGLTGLRYLYLRNNDLTALPADIFDGLSSLESLDLGYNDLTALPADIFDGLSSLESLDLGYNDLTALSADIFDGLSNLRWLYLSGNALTTLSADIFDGLAELDRLSLSGNALTTLPADIFDGLTSLDVLTLSDNPFNEGIPSLSILFPHGIPVVLHLDFVAILDGLPPTLEITANQRDVSTDISEAFVGSLGSRQYSANPLSYRLIANNSNVSMEVVNHILTVTGVNDGQTIITVVGVSAVSGSRVEITHPQQVMVTVELPKLSLSVTPLSVMIEEGEMTELRVLIGGAMQGDEVMLMTNVVSDRYVATAQVMSTSQVTLYGVRVGTATVELTASGEGYRSVSTVVSVEVLLELSLSATPMSVELRKGETMELEVAIDGTRRGYEVTLTATASDESVVTAQVMSTLSSVTLYGAGEGTATVELTASGAGYRPETIMVEVRVIGICERTEQVRDGIIAALSISGDSAVVCESVSSTHLATINDLDLSSQNIKALEDGDFAGLVNLQSLSLSTNSLTTLPEHIFDGLTSLEELHLDENPLDEGLPNFETLFPYEVPSTLHLYIAPVLGELPSMQEVVAGGAVSADISSAFVSSSGSRLLSAYSYRIIVDDPKVATATVTNNGTLTVTGYALGQTAITVVGVDSSGEVTHPQQLMVTVELPELSLQITPTSVTLEEGEATKLEVIIGGMVGTETPVTITVTELGEGNELAEVPQVMLPLDDGSYTTMIEIVAREGDDDLRGDRSVTALITVSDGERVATASLTVNIVEDDRQVTAQFTVVGIALPEGGVAEAMVGLNVSVPTGGVTVVLTVTGEGEGQIGLSNAEEDEPATSVVVVVEEGMQTANFYVRAIEDEITEDAVSYQIAITNVSDEENNDAVVATGTQSMLSVTVADDDVEIIVSFAQTQLNVVEGESAEGMLELSVSAPTGGVTVVLTVADGGEEQISLSNAEEDEPATSVVVVVEEGMHTASFYVRAIENEITEDEMSYQIAITNVSDEEGNDAIVVTGTTSMLSVTVTDDDTEITVSFAQSLLNVVEGELAEGTLELSESAPTGGVTVVLTVADGGEGQIGLGNAEEDEPATSVVVIVEEGMQTANFYVRAIEDEIMEEMMDYQIAITRVSDEEGNDAVVGIGTPSMLAVSVTDKVIPELSLQVTPTSVTLEEGDSTKLEIAIGGVMAEPVTITVTELGEGNELAEMTQVMLPLDDGSYTTMIEIVAREGSDELQGDRSVTAIITVSDGERTATASLTMDIVEDDRQVTAQFTATEVALSEGEIAEATVELSESAPTGGVTVVLTAVAGGEEQIGLSNAEADKPATSVVVIVEEGMQTAIFYVRTIEDEMSYQIAITNVFDEEGNDAVVGISTQSMLTVIKKPVILSVEPDAVTVAEGKRTEVQVSLTGVSEDVTVTVTMGGEEVSTLSLSADNNHIAMFTYVARDDVVDEIGDGETIEYEFSVDGYEDESGATTRLEVTVTDDDTEITVNFAQSPSNVMEGESVESMLELSESAPAGGVTVVLTVADGGEGQIGLGNAEEDEPATSVVVIVEEGMQTANFYVMAIEDEIMEEMMDYQIAITDVSDVEGNDVVVATGTQSMLTVSVTDKAIPENLIFRIKVFLEGAQ